MFNHFFQQSCLFLDNVEIYVKIRVAADKEILECVRIEYWITKATNTKREFVIFITFPLQDQLQYKYIVFIVAY